MKKLIPTILIVVLLLGLGGVAFMPNVAHADCSSLVAFSISDCIGTFFAGTANIAMSVAGWFVSFAAIFLSASINLTLHMKELYDKTPAIGLTWTLIRDLSSIFIIFMLLYSAIVMIIGVDGPKFSSLVVKIFLAGIFINFSLFFTRLAIDTSNLVSLQFYRAIAPNTEFTSDGVGRAFSDGGLSSVLLQSLKIQRVYDNNGVLKSNSVNMGIIIAGVGGVIVMITAAFSFLAAAIAFSIRVAILVFLMAFSPVVFVGMIFPSFTDGIGGKWLKYLKDQCLFMPAYLLLLYVALRLLNGDPNAAPGTTGITSFLTAANPNASIYGGEGVFNLTQVGIIIHYVIAIIFINLPLVVAMNLGGRGMKWAPTAKDISKKIGGYLGQHTIGRVSKNVSDRVAKNDFAVSNPNLAVLTNKGLGKISGASFGASKGGYDKRFKEYSKARAEYANKNLKLGDNASVEKGMDDWRSGTEELEARRDAALILARNTTMSASGRRLAQEKVDAAQEEIDKRNAGEEKHEEYLKKIALNKKKEAFAQNMESSRIFFTTKKARKDAADAIRKELKKGKKDKAIDAIKELLEDSEKGGKESEGKEGPKEKEEK